MNGNAINTNSNLDASVANSNAIDLIINNFKIIILMAYQIKVVVILLVLMKTPFSKIQTKIKPTSNTSSKNNFNPKVKTRSNDYLSAYSSVSLDAVRLRHSSRITADKKSKEHLQYLGFIAAPGTLDDSNDSIAPSVIASTSCMLSQKEASNHLNKSYFAGATVTEVKNLEANDT